MFEPELPEMPQHEADELIGRLKRLPRAAAPADFSEQLHARIARETALEQSLSAAAQRAVQRPSVGMRIFSGRNVAYGLGAAALLTIVFLKVTPQQTPPSSPLATSEQPSGTMPRTLELAPATRQSISAAPNTTAGTPSASSSGRGAQTGAAPHAAVPGGGRSSSEMNAPQAAAPGLAAVAPRKDLPPELMRDQRMRTSSLVGGQLSTVSGGQGGAVDRQQQAQGAMMVRPDSNAGVAMSPFGAFAALARGIDSVRVRDSIRKAHLKVRPR